LNDIDVHRTLFIENFIGGDLHLSLVCWYDSDHQSMFVLGMIIY